MSNSSEIEKQSFAALYINFKQEQKVGELSEEEIYIRIAIHKVKADFHKQEIKRLHSALNSGDPKNKIGRPKKWDDNFLADFDNLVQQVMADQNKDQRSALAHLYAKVYCLSKYPNHSPDEIEYLIEEGESDLKLMIDAKTESEFSRMSTSEVFELFELKEWSSWIHTIENKLGEYRNRVKKNKND